VIVVAGARARKVATPKVDETVENQENPVTSETERPSTETEESATPPKMAAANRVDETVENQMNPGVNMVDRTPEPQIVADSAGIEYDVSKSTPELVVDDRAEEKATIKQNEAVLNPAEWREEDENKEYFEIYFVETGLSTTKVWKKGESLKVLAGDEDDWMKLSASEQKDRYGRVMFEKR
jgi:hypothetical protein